MPRTRATERVRRTVQSTRRSATTRQTSSTSTRGRRRTTTKRSSKGRATASRSRKSTTKRRKTRRKTTRRRKGGRRLAVLRRAYAASTDHQYRIARSLGLSDRVLHKLNRNNVSFPVLSTDEPSTSRGATSRSETHGQLRPLARVAPALDIFGTGNDYEPQDESDGERVPLRSRQDEQVACSSSSKVDFLGGLLEQQSVLLDKKSELKMDNKGTLRLVGGTSTSTSRTGSSNHERSTAPTPLNTERVHKSVSEAPRAASSSLEYDTRYKPHRVSRVDKNCIAAIANTIEDVVNDSHAQYAEPEPPERNGRRRHKNSTESDVPYANESHNVARLKAVTESQGWINSLKLTVPKVINSLDIFQDSDVAEPSCSSSNSINSYCRSEIKAEHVRVKKKPQEYYGTHDEHHDCRDQNRQSHRSESKRKSI